MHIKRPSYQCHHSLCFYVEIMLTKHAKKKCIWRNDHLSSVLLLPSFSSMSWIEKWPKSCMYVIPDWMDFNLCFFWISAAKIGGLCRFRWREPRKGLYRDWAGHRYQDWVRPRPSQLPIQATIAHLFSLSIGIVLNFPALLNGLTADLFGSKIQNLSSLSFQF